MHTVFGVAERAEGTGPALEGGRGDVIEHERAVFEMPGGERVLDRFLARPQPVHGRVEVVLVGAAQREHLAERARGRRGPQPTRQGELGGRLDHLGHDHGDHQVTRAGGDSVDELLETQVGKYPQHRGDMAVREAADDVEAPLQAGGGRPPLEHGCECVDLLLGPARQVGQRAVLDLAPLAVALAQQDRRRGARFGTLATYMSTIKGAFPSSTSRNQQEVSFKLLLLT